MKFIFKGIFRKKMMSPWEELVFVVYDGYLDSGATIDILLESDIYPDKLHEKGFTEAEANHCKERVCELGFQLLAINIFDNKPVLTITNTSKQIKTLPLKNWLFEHNPEDTKPRITGRVYFNEDKQ